MRRPMPRGFTLVEMAVTLLIVGIMTALAYGALSRAKPRATFDSASAELQSVVHQARQHALAQGVDVAVLVFPDFDNGEGTGRLVVLQDAPTCDFFAATAFVDFDPAKPVAPADGQVVTTLDLPRGVLVGPKTGLGVAKLPFPYDSIDTGVACSLCGDAADHRGAVVFDPRGRTRFYRLNGGAVERIADTGGHSLSVYATDLVKGGVPASSTLVVTQPQGIVRTIPYAPD